MWRCVHTVSLTHTHSHSHSLSHRPESINHSMRRGLAPLRGPSSCLGTLQIYMFRIANRLWAPSEKPLPYATGPAPFPIRTCGNLWPTWGHIKSPTLTPPTPVDLVTWEVLFPSQPKCCGWAANQISACTTFACWFLNNRQTSLSLKLNSVSVFFQDDRERNLHNHPDSFCFFPSFPLTSLPVSVWMQPVGSEGLLCVIVACGLRRIIKKEESKRR